jgi:DNA adenine methylase
VWNEEDFHPMTLPELRRWFAFLSARLRHVRIVNGDWARVCTSGALKMLEVRMKEGVCGIFFDPPYGHAANRAALYAEEDFDVADAVRDWCLAHGDDPDYRIVLAGFDGEHNGLEAHGWRAVAWFKSGFLKGGMKQQGKIGHQQHRERLWLSPHCLQKRTEEQPSLIACLEA